MDRRTTHDQEAPRALRSNAVLVLEIDDVELLDEPADGGRRGHRFPPAISDWELSLLVDECTSELCRLGAYQYSAYAG